VDLVRGHEESNQHGDKEPTKPTQALKERWGRGLSSEPVHHTNEAGRLGQPQFTHLV
jgi:hypothetical protein